MKKLATVTVVLSLFLASAAFSVAWADPWAVVANHDELTIHTIDLGTDPPTVYGPFLEGELGELGTSGPLLDVAVTPDGHYALVSNFGSHTVYRIDLSDPANPTLEGFVDFGDIGFRPQDIDIASNGEFALVVDGVSGNQMAIIDLIDFPQSTTRALTTENARAVAVAIAPDNRTVILCDEFNTRIIYGELDPTAGLKSENWLLTGAFPINVAISPYDSETVLVANDLDGTVSVFWITEPGNIVPGEPSEVENLPGGEQSIAFSPDGKRAYVLSYGWFGSGEDKLSWLQIKEDGEVELGKAGVATFRNDIFGGFFGVDVLAITPDGSHALVGNPGSSGKPIENVTMVDLSNWELEEWEWTEISTGSNFPVGIAVFNQFQPSVLPVYADIRPGCCPNHLELRGWGDMPVAVLGAVDFEVTDIDITTVWLSREGNGKKVAPIRWRYKDVSTPFEGERCECHTLGPDCYEDLALKFRNREIVEALGEVEVGEEVVLTIRGKLLNGTAFEGIDCVKVIRGRCPISTAAEDSRMAKDAQVLRKMRDRYLSANYLGRVFVSLYYEQSPKLADFILKYPFLKSFVRVALYPWVKASRLVIEKDKDRR